MTRFTARISSFVPGEEEDKQVNPFANDFVDDPRSSKNRQHTGTFVGTPLYVSPEMLDLTLATPASDLWALGCIIYQCLAGDVPFRGGQEHVIFTKILERDFLYPEDMNEDAIDLIDQLLQIDPTKRLGAGSDGSMNDFAALKQHPFFKGIDFKSLVRRSPPIIKEKMVEPAPELPPVSNL